MKTLFGLAALIFTLGVSTASAETYYVPGSCAPAKASLEVRNTDTQHASMWIQLPTFPVDEIRYDLEPQSSLVIRGREFLDRSQGFAVKTYSKFLSFTWSCEGKSFPLSSWTSPESSYQIQSHAGDLQLLNLSPTSQDVTWEVLDTEGQTLDKSTLHFEKYYETQRVAFKFPAQARELKVTSAGRLHTVLLDEQDHRQPTQIRAPAALSPSPDQVYFLISTRSGSGESYVIGIQDPKMIETARQQILNPQLEKIIVAGITLGNQGVNRNFSSPDRSPYSWSVSRVDSFSDFALIDCDGSPDIIEEHLMERIQTGGNICFWRYRVIRELSLEQVQRGY